MTVSMIDHMNTECLITVDECVTLTILSHLYNLLRWMRRWEAPSSYQNLSAALKQMLVPASCCSYGDTFVKALTIAGLMRLHMALICCPGPNSYS